MTEQDILHNLFMGSLSERYEKLHSDPDITLVHYTSASVLTQILERKYVWMRNARCMNDSSEVDYAISCIRYYFSDTERQRRFRDQCNGCHPSVFDEVDHLLSGHLESFSHHTYLTCLSEHNRKNDRNGRLSMWRGYGSKGVPVAVVLRKEALIGDGPYGLNGYPVQYMTPDDVVSVLDDKVRLMSEHRIKIAQTDPETFKKNLFGMFQSLIATIKHPGFEEESEWRLVYQPTLYPSAGLEKHKLVTTHNGMPQTIYRIPIDGEPINEGHAVTPDQILEKLIIGPCSESGVVISALRDALTQANVTNAADIVDFCGIPYREKL